MSPYRIPGWQWPVKKWLDTVDNYDRAFCHAVGSPESLAKVAQRMEASHLKGVAAARALFT